MSEVPLYGSRRKTLSLARMNLRWSFGSLNFFELPYRRTLELVLHKSHASFLITFRPPGAEDRSAYRGTSPIRKCPPPQDPSMTLGIGLR